ncbi:Aldo-ket-red domain-containing protein [Aphelenchoides fujianensis]|nr:Aldo-ket-red domain-containing protein [Aphelenchoides fujianensis]
MPLVGLGTSLSSKEEFARLPAALSAAMAAGCRLVDTAPVYGTEAAVGEALAAAGARRSVFLVSKLPAHAMRPAAAQRAFERTLRDLRTDFVDLLLVHSPMAVEPNAAADGPALDAAGRPLPAAVDLVAAWRVLEAFYRAGRVRAIGLSNVNERQLRAVWESAEVKPHVLQIELHVHLQQERMVALCRRLDVAVMAYGALCSPGRSVGKPGVPQVAGLQHPAVLRTAAELERSPAQVVLRLLAERGIAAVPKSVTPERVRENLRLFDFRLRPEQRERLAAVEQRARLFPYAKMRHHPEYPFHDEEEAE